MAMTTLLDDVMSPAQQAALVDEVITDPTGRGYAAFLPGDPWHAAQLLNAPTETMVGAVTAAQALTWAAPRAYAAIVDAASDRLNPVRSCCLVVRDTVLANNDISLQLPAVQGLLQSLVLGGVVEQSEADALIYIATRPASRAQVLGLGTVSVDDLRNAGII